MRVRLLGHSIHVSIVVLALVEVLLFACALRAAEYIRFDLLSEPGFRPLTHSWLRASLFSLAIFTSYFALGLYTARQRARAFGISVRIALGVFVGFIAIAVVFYLLPELKVGRGVTAIAAAFALIWSSMARWVFSRFVDIQTFKKKVLVFGCGERARAFARLRRRSDRRGYNLVGFVCAAGEGNCTHLGETLSAQDGLLALCKRLGVDEVVVAMEDRRREFPARDLLECRMLGIEVVDLVTFLERETGSIYLDGLSPSWMIFGGGFRRDNLRQFTVGLVNFLASVLLLAVTLPVMLLTALAIRIEDGYRSGGIFYRQERIGLHGKPFELLKFRSMRVDAESGGTPQWAQKNDPRVTRVGALIRRTRIDELPQLLNVLRGQMSFVGPRPERPHFVAELQEAIPYYAQRHSVKPGITGWAQLCYPYGASEQDAQRKLQYDLYYVKNNSLLFDLAILVQTVEVVFMGKGAR